ncbi:hypothetical protein TSAR_006495 [Trichomalopsis sarcophagae]|uniref:DNA (cytosine-5)-methyltransferase n=1 Tax=Trichomalopsis sarcophagae TaxID=543379 RepID=A0A232ER49_9HYME|nr:hypothetical protein TSAR_006495 [Trichomalopsis sarcophagae]
MLVEANGAAGGAISTNGQAHSDDDDPKKPKEEIQDDENYVEDQQPNKRVKTGKREKQGKKEMKKFVRPAEPICEICLQKLNDEDLRLYIGHPNNAVDEYSVLLDPKLCLFNGDELDITEGDARALNKVTCFSVYDKNGHLCPFDGGLIEKNINIYFSGYVKPIYDDDPSIEGGIPGKDMGPIVEWWVSGFDGGEQAIVSFSTEIGDYVLMDPSEEYAAFMISVREKSFMSKTVIEFLLDEESPSYEDLLNKLQTVAMPKGLPKFTEDILLHHAQFICDQIVSFDESATTDDPLLITTPCMRALIDLAGITFNKGKTVRKGKKRNSRRQEDDWRRGLMRKAQKEKKPSWTKATATQLVNNVFDSFFPDQLANNNTDTVALKRRRCGVCEPCQQPDCGACSACKSMIKFGGPGRSKQACVKRRCPNMEIQEANDEDPDDQEGPEPDAEPSIVAYRKKLGNLKSRTGKIEWVGKPIGTDFKGSFYSAVELDSETIEINDFVFIESVDPTVPLQIVKVIYMWENKMGIKMFHATWLWRGSETVLGETSNSSELFLVDDCQDVPVSYVKSKTTVLHRDTPDNWNELGNTSVNSSMDESKEDITSFYYQKRYDPNNARFEDPLPDLECRPEIKYRFCSACTRCTCLQQQNRPQVFDKLEEKSSKEVLYGMVKFKDEEFRVGSAVFLQPGTFKFKYPLPYQKANRTKREVDEDRFPEYYRKFNDRVKGSNFDTPEPFEIGYITSIYATTNVKLLASTSLHIKVKKLYRPENTFKSESLKGRSDLNMLYWSEEEVTLPFTCVVGKCYLTYSENLDISVEEWTVAGPNRFYFTQMYSHKEEEFDEPPSKACSIGKLIKKSDKIKSKSKKTDAPKLIDIPPDFPQIKKKLRTLDVFAGCGGLSEGLHQAGVAESSWAIEVDEAAAHAYRLNNPNAAVFTGDCNAYLKKVMNGETMAGGQRLPQRGEVDLLCGGPPCQGFSGMNRFNSRAYSLFKNSLVVSYLSYCDYYRPRFFIMENVRNFVTFKKSMVLKLTLRCLIRMGYQCTFGILQAGNYGVPQTRRRMIILAAAPGEVLPKYPNPLHVFSKSACNLSVVIDNKKYFPTYDWVESAPYKVTTIRDALSDLPSIKSGKNEDVMSYGSEPLSHFQRKLRAGVSDSLLLDHICKDLGPLVEARMAHIPTVSGSDWRDLPNIVIPLSDGNHTNKLKYNYHDKKAGKSSTGALRGVCSCCTGKECNPLDRQDNTLIPWCLPHTGNRHNHWAGLYGRIEWDGFFSTTITNPEPMGKQGRVLHPDQTRVVSVRECARSQGFPDNFRFYGNIQDKHRQVGNAVPPPLAAAIGMEIRKSVSISESSSNVKNEEN